MMTEEQEPPVKFATNYQAQPEDGFKVVLIYLDKKLLSLYNQIKGMLGINDDFVSRLLRLVRKPGKK